jgi:pyruvate ferredoxin oxidoreductase gamma subunit
VRAKLKAKPTQKVFTVDASKIAVETIGRSMPNSCMLGAVNRATSIVSMEVLLDDVKGSFGKKFAQKIIDGNLTAVKRGYEEVHEG